jgi:hypothetical protein
MSLPDGVSSYLAFASPLARPLHFAGLEIVFALCFALTIRDVVACYRRGDRFPLFQWLVIFVYGVAMELVAFNAYPDYEHGQFTVQLYHHKLPLYVTFVYVVFHYTALRLASRSKLAPIPEAVTCGLALVLLDVPFDVAGADARWWTWLPSGHDVAQRWLGVPLTSYEWYLIFGAVLAWMCRAIWPRVETRTVATYVAVAPLVALGVIVVGVLGFLPFHALEAIGVPDGAIVLAHVAIALVIAARARMQRAQARAPRGLAVIPVILAGWLVAVIASLWHRGEATDGPAKLAIAVLASTAMLVLFVTGGGSRVSSSLHEREGEDAAPIRS